MAEPGEELAGGGSERVFNFSAGPAALPTSVLEKAQEELLDFRGCGVSVMEMSHRSKEFKDVAADAESDLRELMDIPEDYAVLFLQGGATMQFSAIPMNLADQGATADYVRTGHWGQKAVAAAEDLMDVSVVADSKEDEYTGIPPQTIWELSDSPAYLHYTPNETIAGVEFHWVPDTTVYGKPVPLVADMSSTLLSRPVDVRHFGLIYAGAQKNIGPSGLTVVIVHRELMGRSRPGTPGVIDYATQAVAGSMINTPPTFAWYVAGLVFKWLKLQGGLSQMGLNNRAKSDLLYNFIDASDYYSNPVDRYSRSWMNVPFTLADPSQDSRFLKGAAERGLVNLEGHRSVGGMRASLYNAMPMEGVEALVAYMREFEQGA